MAIFEVDVGNATYQVDAPDEKTAWKMASDVHKAAPQESPSMQAGRKADFTVGGVPVGSSVQGAINALQGPTMGFLDELVGAAAAPFGKYKEARDFIRGATQQFRQEYPIPAAVTSAMTSAPMMLIGGAPVAAAKGVIAPAATTAGRLLTAGKVGTIQGGIAGAGESTAEDMSGVAADAAKHAAQGGALGVAGQGVLGAVGAVGGNVAQRISKSSASDYARNRLTELAQQLEKSSVPNYVRAQLPKIENFLSQTSADDYARIKLAEALSRSSGGIPVRPGGAASPSRAADIQFLGPEATIADVSGQAGKRLLDLLATLPGKTKDLTEQLIRGRQTGRTERIMTAADEALGTQGKGFVSSLNALEATQKAAQAPFRAQLEGLSVRADDDLMKILNREPAAFKAAADLARREGELPIDLSKLKVGDDIPFDALDTVKKALWTIAEKEKVNFAPTAESRAVNGIRVALTNKMDQLSPRDAGGSIYKQARDAFAGPAELRSAIEAGRGSMKTDAIGIGELMKGMSASELEAFRVGALQSLRDKVGTEAGQTSLLNMWKNTGTSDKLKEIFGNDYKKFASGIAKEAKLKELETVGRGSQSAERLLGAEDLSVLPAVGQAVAGAVQGNPLPAMGAIPKIWNQVQTPEVTRNALAELLLQRGPEAQKTLRDLPEFMRKFNEAQARNAALTNALAQQPARNER